jgi:hypothetical protein
MFGSLASFVGGNKKQKHVLWILVLNVGNHIQGHTASQFIILELTYSPLQEPQISGCSQTFFLLFLLLFIPLLP